MSERKKKDSSLKVNDGIEQPPSVNPNLEIKKKGNTYSPNQYVDAITKGDRYMLSRAITLIESSSSKHQEKAQDIVEKCLPHSGNSIRIGITGVPGVGKSTFIESIGKYLTSRGHKLAVLAVDPSSSRSKGSILGDKTRMTDLSTDENAFIRPSPASGSLGGVARKTRESIILTEAAGYDVIFVETVGVGQSETTVHSMVDFFLLLMLAGAGDELQGIKRGIMEMADAILINKADGNNLNNARQARNEYKKALHLFPPTESGWTPKVDVCSSHTGLGMDNVWRIIKAYYNHTTSNGYFKEKRNQQARMFMYDSINQALKDNFYNNEKMKQMLPDIEKDLLNSKISSYMAARKLLKIYYGEK
ncbi:MAG: methylmalonyl Co-A mutase-associated GTPase MeaB [Bacteroidales bacterium]|nr:methylmalonyl Co-A mutase-associated GTPase MeaB [Bacteroidales bacterium]MCF8337080.1 methylmalonyl Co-A mutase-associated GTPase MeaB [Bacteroidales bacterium]